MEYAYYGGEYLPYSEMKIPITDRSIYFADAVYDVCVGRKGEIYQFGRHLKRLADNCRYLKIGIDNLEERLKEITNELILLSRLNEYVIYIQVSRNVNNRRHYFTNFDTASLLVTITNFQHGCGGEPLKLISMPDIRHRLCNIKTTDLLPASLATSEAMAKGADEAIFLLDGFVTEGARSNVSIYKDGKIHTHPKDEKILPGIMRENLIEKANSVGIEVVEEAFTYNELCAAEEVFLTSTTKFLKRCNMMDGRAVGMRCTEVYSALSSMLESDFFDKKR